MKSGKKIHYMDHGLGDALRASWSSVLRTMAEEGRLVSDVELQARRNLTAEQVQLAESEHRIFSLTDQDGSTYYPTFFCNTEIIELAEQVSQRLGRESGFLKWASLTGAFTMGGHALLDALEDGDRDRILHHADKALSRNGYRKGVPTPPITA